MARQKPNMERSPSQQLLATIHANRMLFYHLVPNILNTMICSKEMTHPER